MDAKTKGAWLIHHTNKLQSVNNQTGFDDIYIAGKAGILLSAISATDLLQVPNEKLQILASASNINRLELPSIKELLVNKGLIDSGKSGVEVLGITTSMILTHTSGIFDSLSPSVSQLASIELAEQVSHAPMKGSEIRDEIADKFQIGKADISQLFSDSECIGFVDSEAISTADKLYFNGNIFKRETTKKVKAVLDSMSTADQQKLVELNTMLSMFGCLSIEEAKRVIGEQLYSKVIPVGLFDLSVVSNAREESGYLTLPSAFSKYSDSITEDAFDLAKAFVSSITYGMTKSEHSRGRITRVYELISVLVNGGSIGPVPAIAQDYKILELRGVVQVYTGTKSGRTGPMLRLLKKEIGELALQVITQGDVSEHSLKCLPSAAISRYVGPEDNRAKSRRNSVGLNPRATLDMLSVLRKGGMNGY
jgi:hypothetical protein